MSSEQPSILVVDDDESFRKRLTQSFLSRGYPSFQASTCEEAISVCTTELVCRAVVDLRLAQQSGLQVIEAIRAVSPETQIVMLTGYGSIPTALEATKLGAENYLTKPADAEEILAAFQPNNPTSVSVRTSAHPAPSLARAEWEHIQRVLADCNGNITHAAESLGIPRRSLQRKLAKLPPRT